MKTREWARATYQNLKDRSAADRSHHYTMEQVEEVLEMSILTLVDALADGDELHSLALGRLWVEERPVRTVVSNLPSVSQSFTLFPARTVHFKASRRLRNRLNSDTHER